MSAFPSHPGPNCAEVLSASLNDRAGTVMAPCFEPFAHPAYPGHALSGGIICELYLTTKLRHLPHDLLLQTLYSLKEWYPSLPFTCDRYEPMFLTLVHTADAGTFRLDEMEISFSLFSEALDFYRESYSR